MKNTFKIRAFTTVQKVRPSYGTTRKMCFITTLVFMIFSHSGYSQMAADANLQLDGMNTTLTVELTDTISVMELEVQLGSRESLSDLFSYSFIYDQTTGLPQGMSYSRQGNQVTLGLGEIAASYNMFARVRLKSSGSWSDWYAFVSN